MIFKPTHSAAQLADIAGADNRQPEYVVHAPLRVRPIAGQHVHPCIPKQLMPRQITAIHPKAGAQAPTRFRTCDHTRNLQTDLHSGHQSY